MLYIAVHNALSVNIFQSIGNLCENVECMLLRKVTLAVRWHITVQVLPFLIYSDDVLSVTNQEVVKNCKYVLTL